MRPLIFIITIFILLSCQQTSQVAQISPVSLSCEYRSDQPLIDIGQPRLSWINEALLDKRGLAQTAYQIRVASTKDKLSDPDMWDSEKVVSGESSRIIYEGKPLNSRQDCWWQVRVWDNDDNASPWSEPAQWKMGILEADEWKAQWIGAPWQGEDAYPRTNYPQQIPDTFGPPAPLLRKKFVIEKEIKSAVAYVTGLGYFELYANGKKVGDDVLVPNQTNYGKRPALANANINVPDDFTRYKVFYLAYDLSNLLQKGENTVGSILGNGFYNPEKFWAEGYGTPRFMGQIHLTYQDGSEEVIISDESWKIAKGPILKNMVYYGEIYDARKELDGWSTNDFDDSSWQNTVVKRAPGGELVAHTAYPDKVMETFQPVSIEKMENGDYQVDFGVEISGWVRLNNVDGPAGHQIDISFNGNLYSGENSYICDGNGPGNYAPRFNWFVFSGIEVKNWPGELSPEHLTAEAVYTEVHESATFQTSNELFNDINKIWKRSQVDNMHGGIASDCPHRERSAYTGDGQVAVQTVLYNYDARNFYHKWIQDIHDAQVKSTGYVPNGAPWQPGCGGGVAWGAAICIMPWEFYQHYGAIDMLADNFESMKGYIHYMDQWVNEKGIMYSQRRGGTGEILKWFNLGEWAFPGPQVPDELVHTFYYWLCADITAKAAEILGKTEDAKKYADLALHTKNAFHNTFFDKEKQTYGNGGGNVLALRMGVPDERKKAVLQSLVNNIKANDGHFDTGIFGTRYFFEVLAENDLNDLAYEAMNKKDFPSYGRWIELGSTTSREHWDESGSFNHPMFGGGLVWFYQNLAGMQPDQEKAGFKHIIFKPQVIKDMDSVSYYNLTNYGKAGITWRNSTNDFSMDVKVPVGCEATVYVPVESGEEVVFVNNDPIGITFLEKSGNYELYRVKSGDYGFVVGGSQ